MRPTAVASSVLAAAAAAAPLATPSPLPPSPPPRRALPPDDATSAPAIPPPPVRPPVEEHYFDTVVDHYSFLPTPKLTFPLRYVVSDSHYDVSTGGGPCFFYAGNEADVYQFVNNSGFVLEAAAELGALVVFAEHRYYGRSLPFGERWSTSGPYNASFLTVEQAMADYNDLALHVRERWCMPPTSAFVAFGGSYGANLAMWLRLKNPNVWAGAVASSATPLKRLLRETNGFARIETEAYGNVSARCPGLVRRGWDDLYSAAETRGGRESASRELGLCRPIPDARSADSVHGWVSGALETMAQYGYPYPSAFYEPLPAYPFRVACLRMVAVGTGLGALRAAADVYYNHTGQAGPCYDWDSVVVGGAERHRRRKGQMDRAHVRSSRVGEERDGGGERWTWTGREDPWGYQTCTEVYQPMPTDGVTDFEVPHTPNQTAYYANCMERWGVTPRPDWEETTFMGADIGAGSNIFLTNGQIDPWRAGGIQSTPRGASPDSIVVRTIEGGAHHLDLRASHPLDPPSVRAVREEEKAEIRRWIARWAETHGEEGRIEDSVSRSMMWRS